MPKNDPNRVKLNENRIKYWLAQGARPTDRVARFLGNAEITPMPQRRNNPKKAQPKAKAKERAEIAGSTRKIKKQKGTGTARAGSIKSPVFRGGGRIFGPRPRNYSFKLNKKQKQLARRSALSQKAQDNAIVIVENFSFDAPKTKNYIDFLTNLGIENNKSLIVLGDTNKNVYLSSRNFKGSNVVTASELNTYKIMNSQSLVLF